LKKKVRDNLALEKKQKASEKKRTAVIEKLLSETKAELHDVIIESELNRMMAQMRADIGRFGGTWEDYLKHAGKTEAELRTDWRKDAERRALTQFVLNKISDLEKIVPTDAEIEVELVRLMAVVKDADETRAREYLHQALSNEKVLKFLETGEK
jgi:trigger factor